MVHPQTQNVDSRIPATSRLSDETIPSVRGEWYNYRSVFTPERPLGYLMKCKANKDKPLPFVEQNPDVDLVFMFDESAVRICSPDSQVSLALMGDVIVTIDDLKKVSIAQATVTGEQFDAIRAGKDCDGLVSACKSAMDGQDYLAVTPGMIIAVTTSTGKYCLMRATEVGPEAVRFDACHILL